MCLDVIQIRNPNIEINSQHFSHLKLPGPEGAKYVSPGQRPGFGLSVKPQALKGRHNQVSPLQGLRFIFSSQPRALPWAFILLPLWGEEVAYSIRLKCYLIRSITVIHIIALKEHGKKL